MPWRRVLDEGFPGRDVNPNPTMVLGIFVGAECSDHWAQRGKVPDGRAGKFRQSRFEDGPVPGVRNPMPVGERAGRWMRRSWVIASLAGHDRGSNGLLLGKPGVPVARAGDLFAAGLPNELNNPDNFFPQGCARVCNGRQRRGRGAKRFVKCSADGDFPTVIGNSRQMSDGGYV